ncbi:MAG: hypothetical protein LBG67_03950 [Campylobacteraceae bacterium]|nr:hypothetical protein [Campylobacteraceae bacterium]
MKIQLLFKKEECMSLSDNPIKYIKNFLNKRQLEKPSIVTNPDNKDMMVENDIVGLDIINIKNKERIRLLSSDLTVFNDYAFKYYVPQFILCYFKSYKYIFIDMFLLSLCESTILSKTSKRYLQFDTEEIKIILFFLEAVLNKLDINNNFTEEYLSELKDLEFDANMAIDFWKKHPSKNQE